MQPSVPLPVNPFSSRASRRPTLGLLVDWLEDEYQNAVLCGVADAARDEGAHLVCFTGGELASPHRFSAQRNSIYQLAGPENVDGLMLMSGTFGNAVGAIELARFCQRFRPLPMCSIAVPLPGIPSVLTDNTTGTRQVMQHLLEHHGLRRLAFIRGPEANAEAERRYAIYRETLSAHGLPLEPELVAIGDFRRPTGQVAMFELLANCPIKPDAVMAASDHMAMGAVDALRSRGLQVPGDVAVAGFDDVEEARFFDPPLTTVRQPLYQQGAQAVRLLLAQMQGEVVPECLVLSTELVTRRSCGCASQRIQPAFVRACSGTTAEGWEPVLQRCRTALLRDLRSELGHWEDSDRAESLLDAFIADLRGPDSHAFAAWLDQALERLRKSERELSPWHQILACLRQHALPCVLHDRELWLRAEDRLHEARHMLGQAMERVQAEHRLRAERWARTLSRTGEALVTAFDVVSLARAVSQELPRLGIPSCFLALYEGTVVPAARSKLVLAYDEKVALPAQTGVTFPSRELVPGHLWPRDRRRAHVVEPLFFGEDQLGFVLFELGPREGVLYEMLREQISAALKGALLVQRVVEQDQERQRLLSTLESRAQELQEAYDILTQNQERLLLQERMASLGRLTASIAHEMSSPLAAARAALAELDKLVREYRLSAGDG
ncbi:substrate-binding domain-containing protein, partial [Myxococcota bacterium]